MTEEPLRNGNPDPTAPAPASPTGRKPGLLARGLDALTHLGLGESAMRVGTHLLSLALALGIVWLMQAFYNQPGSETPAGTTGNSPGGDGPPLSAANIPYQVFQTGFGISRLAQLHTNIPTRPRLDIVTYIVQPGDTVFGIAEKFGLQPQTILWGNDSTLWDDPHNLKPGQELNILPVNGTYYQWHSGDGLNGVADYFNVEPEVIVNYPGNDLDLHTIGDYANPNIPAGTWLIIPGGEREFVSWSAPVGVTRENPATAQVLGSGACGAISGGAVGYGTFVWPTDSHVLSGNNYSPESNHRGIDLSGHEGSPIYATDSGVIVYSGWNDYGYGNMIMIDHGRDWQSLYAHLSVISVSCGQSVGQGDTIGLMGSTGNSTGPHLHFELMNSVYGKVNPYNFLPAP
ncbi:MAG: M23 family metallopeptidase [Chloroflexi bacterium]|nr:M23 family metallopeptidase [Chloroflexota bacterium]